MQQCQCSPMLIFRAWATCVATQARSAWLRSFFFEMASVVNFLQQRSRVFLSKCRRVQLLSGRKVSTGRIHSDFQCRLAESTDFDAVVKLSEGLYNGYDFLSVVYHKWLKKENVTMMLLYAGKSLIGLQAGCIVDEGKTLVWRAARVAHNLEG